MVHTESPSSKPIMITPKSGIAGREVDEVVDT